VYFSPLLIEVVAGAAIGTGSRRGGRMPGALASAVLLVGGFVLLARRGGYPLGDFSQTVGATLMVLGALNPSFAGRRFPLLRALGDSSYSLYLTHLFTLGLLRAAWMRLLPPVEGRAEAALFMATSLVAAGVIGWLSFRLLETPMLRWLNAHTRWRADVASAKTAN
jgi:exopolysaccharide production protein ExoZ